MKNRILIVSVLALAFALCFGVFAGAYTLSPAPDNVSPVFAPTEIRFDSMYLGSYSLANIPYASPDWGPQEYYDSGGNLVFTDDTTSSANEGFITYTRNLQSTDLGDLVGVSYIYRNVDPWFLRSSSVYRESDIRFTFNDFTNGRCNIRVEYSYYDGDGYFREGVAERTSLGVTNEFVFDVRNDLVTLLDYNSVPYGSTGFYIDVLTLDFDTPNSVFTSDVTFTAVEGGDIGVAIGPRYLPDIRKNYVNPDIFSWLSSSVQGFLNTPVYGENITFGSLLIILISVPLTIAFLKFFAGG